MTPLNQALSRLLDTMTKDLADPSGEGQSGRKYDNAPGQMAVVVERIGENRYSVAQYCMQGGDKIADPDLELVKHDGQWFPVAIQQIYGYLKPVICDADGVPQRYSPAAYNNLRSFSNTYLRNIRDAHGIKVPKAKAKA